MKNAITVIIIMLLFTIGAQAQKVTQGIIKYNTWFLYGDRAQAPHDAVTTVTFKPAKLREDDYWGQTFNGTRTTIITSEAKWTVNSGTDSDGKPYSHKNESASYAAPDSVYTVEYSKETMKIAGYNCKKVIVRINSGEIIIAYVTEDIAANCLLFPYKKVKGLPLQFEIHNDYEHVLYQAVSIDTTTQVGDEVFAVE